MKLYGSHASPYVRKVRVLAAELAIPLDFELVDIHSLSNSFGGVNPVNRIPALLLDDGDTVLDSRVICEFLNNLIGGDMLSAPGPSRWSVLKLQALGDGILDAAAPRFAELSRPAAQQSPDRLARYLRSIVQTLDALEQCTDQLETVNVGSIAAGCALGYLDFRLPAEDWRHDRHRLSSWFATFANRPSMRETAPGPPDEIAPGGLKT